ncbi:HAD family hydrolase [Paraglaciecola aestuariivivens]
MSEIVKKLLSAIKTKNIKVVSFDVFDTLVFRKVSRPNQVFSLAYQHFNQNMQLAICAEEYRELRVNAEKRVKRNVAHGEVSLGDIYASLPFSTQIKSELKQAELEVEQQVSFVFQPMYEFVVGLRKLGIDVFFISDMYLSREQIRKCFFADYPLLESIPLHVSSEYKLNKASGQIFNFLAEKYSINKSNWMHLGDNKISDFEMPLLQKLDARWLSPQLDALKIFHLESTLSTEEQYFNAARFLSSTHKQAKHNPIAFEIGALVCGPVLLSFVDWIIAQTLKVNSNCILCLMREAEVFAPLIELRLKQKSIQDIRVKKLYASRKSTFWPSINIECTHWFEDLIYTLVQRRGYTVDDFYRDFLMEPDEVYIAHKNVLVRDADGVFHQGQNLLKQLTTAARLNSQVVKQYIVKQKTLFTRYYQHNIGEEFSQCTVVDLGNGGTIQYQIQAILDNKCAGNLLFYSSDRIYRYSDSTYYSSFINAQTDQGNLRQILSRSPECLEPFLVGDCGTTLGYADDKVGSPVTADHLSKNSAPVLDFMRGVLNYFEQHHELGFGNVVVQQVIPILYRYIQLPTKAEAELFTEILHQDNFGSNDSYPIVTPKQIDEVRNWGVNNFYQEFCRYPNVKVGKIHWPQAVITLLSERFLSRQMGLMSMDTDSDVINLLERLLERKWDKFAVYGAGIFFEKLMPYLQKHNLQVECLIDRKAEISGTYQVANFDVVSLDSALQSGTTKILISSFAFKDEIARNIYDQSCKGNFKNVEILSL